MFKRLSILVLVLFMLVFSASMETPVPQSLPLMGFEPADNNRVWAEHRFFERMEQRTGIHFEFEQHSDLQAYFNRLDSLRPGDASLPAVLFKARLSPVKAQELLDRGVLVNLEPYYLNEYAPNLSAMLMEHPEYRAAISLPDGSIPALPYLSGMAGQNALWVNQDWLTVLNLPMPQNLEEFNAVLEAFRDKDPNRNGKRDEIPLSFLGPYDLKYLAHAWGLVGNDFNISLDEGNKVRFMPLEEGFRDFLSWARSAFASGLLDKDGFLMSDSLRRQTDAKADNRFGAFFGPLPTAVVPVDWSSSYKILLPLRHDGVSAYRAVASPVFYGAFALTSACEDIPAMLAWVDTLYSGEGAVLAGIGLEGEDYAVDGDGSWRLLSEPGDMNYYSQVVMASDQTAPGTSTESFQQRFADPLVRALTAQTLELAAVSELPFPDYPLTVREEAAVAPLQAAIGRYVDESIARFVLGEWEVNDENMETFREALNNLGIEDFLRFWQTIYDGRMARQ